MINPEFRQAAKLIEERFPERFAMCYPRRIVPPQGYGNPRLYAAEVTALTIMPLQQSDNGFLGGMNICAQILVENKVPTYFIHPDFFKAVAATDVPEDFDLSDLRWPADAMLFCLPLKESKEVFGIELPWIGVARTPTGDYQGLLADYKVAFKVPRFCIHFPVFGPGMPEDFGGMWPIDGKLVGLINSMPFLDNTYVLQNGAPGHKALTEEENKAINSRAMRMAVSLMLAMVAAPEHIEMGQCIRVAKPHPRPEKALDALWAPNIIGRCYAAPSESKGGTHASPRTHLRRGHFRREVGWRELPAGVQPKLIWIRPTWINL